MKNSKLKQVPPDLTGGKVLWAHPDGYFLNENGRKLAHTYSPAMQRNRPNMHSAYPKMRQYGSKHCHYLICVTFHGPRPEGYECDHINGNKLDYSAQNLEWVTPAENRRRAKYLRIMHDCEFDPRIFNAARMHEFFAMPIDEFKKVMYYHKNDE
jgi:hypothetical protein